MFWERSVDSDSEMIVLELAITVQPFAELESADADGVSGRTGSLQEVDGLAVSGHAGMYSS